MKKKLLIISAVAGSIILFIFLVFLDSTMLKKTPDEQGSPFGNINATNPTPTQLVQATSTPLPHDFFIRDHSDYSITDRSFDSTTSEVELNVKDKRTDTVFEIDGKVKLFGSVAPYFNASSKYMLLVSGTYITRSGTLISLDDKKILKKDIAMYGDNKIFYKDYLLYDGVIKGNEGKQNYFEAPTVSYYDIKNDKQVDLYNSTASNMYMLKAANDGVLTIERSYLTNPNDTTTLKNETIKLDLRDQLK